MPRVNVNNAHIRSESKRRQDSEVVSDEAKALLENPAFQRGFDVVKNGLVSEIMTMQHDGGVDVDNYSLEICRTLRTLEAVRRGIILGVQREKLRLHDFTAKPPETKED